MGVRLQIIQEHLKTQQDLSAVQRFARLHDEGRVGDGPLYHSQIPLSRPVAGQQYGFQVDLDACTGCKACVVGCNKMNGLDPDETWRAVGTIHGGTTTNPIQQTVTTACHHCLDPACMSGCPVGAYEKNPQTGIVKHLDDQCIGCQYCTLTCPYEVPQYNKRLGIVRKCDMCQDRLLEGEAPACVESCPNGAIAIRIVDVSEVLDDAQGDAFLPGAPSPGITGPTTSYKTQRNLPRNVLPANFYDVRPAAKHMPLVVMLVLTQLSVGAYVVDALLNLEHHSSVSLALGRAHSLVALGLGLLAMGAATLHLGRPLYAFRAFIGLRTSWMSREIVAIGAFVQIAVLHALTFWKPEVFEALKVPELLGASMDRIQRTLAMVTAMVGVLAAACSVMIYVVTRRKWWSGSATGKFFGTAAVLGLGTMAATTSVTAYLTAAPNLEDTLRQLLIWFGTVSVAKLLYEASMFRHLLDKQQGDLKRTALLMTRDLKEVTKWRFILGALGGVVLPGLVLLAHSPPAASGTLALTILATILTLVGELLERTLFFTAVSAPRMPGAIGR